MERELRKLRAKNAKLMTSNLSMLMAVREAEADVDDLLATLRDQCTALERAGIAVPEKCQALLEQRADAIAAAETARVDEDVTMGEDTHPGDGSSAVDVEHHGSASGADVESTDEL